ncbi:beta-ketoacyl synthase N-terminal-like domain-containing protein [Paenibacillus pedocola]|uniref:beta-ketoacyl synthase N-terminal-like domain-containing protein n=1 Tax=Paenibacillus pedocola TaxID=3242193 RepID=UPI002877D732|nr:beta-ketoacyl synthase N-terminal-like domain-containing protein [Paenibacillus typhae]
MNERRVVIVDFIYDYPGRESGSTEELMGRKNAIWQSRVRELERTYNQEPGEAASFDGVFYPSVEEHFKLEHISGPDSRFLLSSERITLSLLQTLADRNVLGPKSNLLVSIGTAQTDSLSKFALMRVEGEAFGHAVKLIDPLGYLKLLQLGRPPAVELISEASTSGISSMYSAYAKIRKGEFDIALTGGSSAVTFPVPYELSQFGIGAERYTEPFEDGASGRYFSEGGAAFLLKERELALSDGDTILAEIKDISAGTMGNPVVNRTAVKKLVSRSLENAGVDPEADVFLELYGRGNEIDDTAEFSCLKTLQKTYRNLKGGFLKEGVHYIVGYYGLIGACRLLDSQRMQTLLQSREVASPNAFIGRISGEQWSISPGDYRLYSAVSYSMHGNCYNLLLQLDAESRYSRGGARE